MRREELTAEKGVWQGGREREARGRESRHYNEGEHSSTYTDQCTMSLRCRYIYFFIPPEKKLCGFGKVGRGSCQ